MAALRGTLPTPLAVNTSMAPNMFSYLRPGHAKRSASPVDASTYSAEYYSSPRSPISPFPPQLPPIARVASKLDSHHEHLAPSIASTAYSTFSRSTTSLMPPRTASTPTPHAAKAKSRLTLRNPMSLLMRRRSGQTLDPLADESLVTHRSPSMVPPMPDNYDPSIRGHFVHDFNAPRPNRNFSYNNAYTETQSAHDLGRVSPQKIEREHTPVFREHFDDDTSYEQSQQAIRAEQLANKDFLARNAVQFSPPARSPPPPPPLPKDPPPPPPPVQTIQSNSSVLSSSVLSPVQEAPSPTSVSMDVTPRKRKSTKTPPPARSRATSVTDPSFQPAGLPAHCSSRASRFSFQIPGGSDSAQEKILEERHKAKEAEKASKQVRMSTNTVDDEYDEYGMDDYDGMDGGFDEEIPMLGEEDEFTGLGDQTLDSGINAFDFSSLSIQHGLHDPMSPMNQVGQLQTPVDVNGIPIGFAMSQLHVNNDPSPTHLDLDDDMYFDDGLIGDQDDGNVAGFDENEFDDPNGPLFERKVKFTPVEDTRLFSSETGYEADDDTVSRHLEKSQPSLAHTTSVAAQRTLPDFNNMDAYHSALADAANRADAAGRFARKASVDAGQPSSDVDDFSSLSNSRPSLVPDDGRFSLDTDGFPPDDDHFGMSSSYIDDYDYSDFDSALEDDPIIAAANAEALAYDEEGFYGSEFGFYASGVGDTPSAFGGSFGASGLGRTVSGRNAVREPNLTPITERSEYSTRNSFISLNHFRDGQQPIQSPALAQLARMSPYGWPEEEDMSLDSLMKLRKGAFGGSVASLPGSTSNSPRTSSPIGVQLVPRMASPAGNRMKEHNGSELENGVAEENMEDGFEGGEDNRHNDEGLMDAVNAAYEDEVDNDHSGGEERPESPTLTGSDYNSLSSPTNHSHLVANDTSSLPPISELYAQHSKQPTPHTSLNLPSNTPLYIPPYGIPLTSPLSPQRRPPAPPSIDTSLSFPSATVPTSSAPRRQSMGLISPISPSSPMTPNGTGVTSAWRSGHSRKGSAADSVTYVREHDEAGEGRWVLERRRTAESGELELVGREIIEGGKI